MTLPAPDYQLPWTCDHCGYVGDTGPVHEHPQAAVEPVATMWREKNTHLYPGILFDLTDAGKSLPLGVRYQLYTSPPDHREAMRLALDSLKIAQRDLPMQSITVQAAIAALEGALK